MCDTELLTGDKPSLWKDGTGYNACLRDDQFIIVIQ